jgi:KaiC/GvpD/RAD55 family RecA-like ATPase
MEDGIDVLESLGDGKRVLCVGPPMTGKREFLVNLVRGAAPLDREALVVSTDASASTLLDRYPGSFNPGHAGIVDCTGTDLPDRDPVLESVPSPADLTGVAVAVSKALERIGDRSGGLHRPLIGIDSLATLSIYTDFDRLFRFLHSLGGQVVDRDGLFLATLDSDGLDPQSTARLRSTADGRIEFRNRNEFRLVGVGDTERGWVESTPNGSVEVDLGTAATDDDDAGRTSGAPDASTAPRVGASQGSSLAAFVERTLAGGPTLTLCNVDDGHDTGAVESHFARLNVAVRPTSLDVEAPRNLALLHDGDDLLAASPIDVVSSALDAADPETDPVSVLEAAPQELFASRAADRRTLLGVSRTIERLAVGDDGGDLHAGFQSLSNLLEDPETMSVYERLDETGVTVHLYGVADADLPGWDGLTAHGLPEPELEDAWFLVYEPPEDDTDRGGTLVTLEDDPGVYRGFWSYDPEVVASTRSFVESTYLP